MRQVFDSGRNKEIIAVSSDDASEETKYYDCKRISPSISSLSDSLQASDNRVLTISAMSNYDNTGANLASNKGKTVTVPDAKEQAAKDAVGDRLLDSYPDRNPGETAFPHCPPSLSTPEIEGFYKVVRERIATAVQVENFGNGHFKSEFSATHGSIAHIILKMQLSGEVNKVQYEILKAFNHTWCAATGKSKKYDVLNDLFIAETGLAAQADRLFDMFDEEKVHPNPYPLPEKMKYVDPVTQRKRLEAIVAEHQAAKLQTSSSSVAVASPPNIAAPFSSGSINFVANGISKAHLLTTLKSYNAANSNDSVLRNAWNEISNHKGELTSKSIDELSPETTALIYNQIQSDAEGTLCSCAFLFQKLTLSAALNVKMPMGSAISDTIAKLEAMQLNATASPKAQSDLYAASEKESKASSLKGKKGKKGRENAKRA